MLARLRRAIAAEIEPAFAGFEPSLALALLAGCAWLINKRYLADRAIVPFAPERWQALAAWLLATVVLVALVDRRGAGPRAVTAAVLAGGLVLALPLAVSGQPWHLRWPWVTETWLMLLLAWLVAAPAAAAARHGDRRPVAAMVGLLVVALLAVALVTIPGPWRPMLVDHRYDKLNWGLLTAGWLLAVPRLTTLGLAGGRFRDEGGGLGRWRFWAPWVLGLLAFMVVVIVGYAGRQPSFTQYYPMFRADWFAYDPRRDGWGFLVGYELTYVAYFVAWEYFFRGFLLFRLEPRFGPGAIALQAVPFVLLHIGKPGPEFHSSLVAGVVLGWLAWRARSFWPCFLLHCGAALTMDVTALLTSLGPPN